MPVITEFAPDKASPQEAGTIVTWTAKASDAENDPIVFRFFLNSLPVTDWQSNNKWAWTASEGEAQVEVQVRDGKHAGEEGFDDSSSKTFVINAPNQKPAIINFGPDKLGPQEVGSTIVWTVDVSDAENDPILYKFFLNGNPQANGNLKASGPGRPPNANLGDNEVEVRIIDGNHADQDGFDDSKSARFMLTAPNKMPIIATLGADKVSPQDVGEVVTWSVDASDAENDPILYKFFLNGEPASEWLSQGQWAWKTTDANLGDNEVEVRIIDGNHADQDGFDDSKSSSP